MKKTFKYILSLTFAFLLFFSLSKGNVLAEGESDSTPCSPGEVLGPINRDTKVVINGEEISLFCVFEDRGKAMETLKQKIPEYLEAFAKENNLGKLNSSNWKRYEGALRNTDYPPTTEEGRLMAIFFDIYENDALNNETIKYVSARNGKLNDRELEKIAPNIPYGILPPGSNEGVVTKCSFEDFWTLTKISLVLNVIFFLIILFMVFRFFVGKGVDRSKKKRK